MIKEFKQKIATAKFPLLIFSNNLRLLILLRKIAIAELKKRFEVKKIESEFDSEKFEEIIENTGKNLFGQEKVFYLVDFHLNTKLLSKFKSVFDRRDIKFVMDASELNQELLSAVKPVGTVLEYKIRFSTDLIPLAKEVLGITKAEKIKTMLENESPENALNIIQIARLCADVKTFSRGQTQINDVINLVLSKCSPVRILKDLDQNTFDFIPIVWGLCRYFSAMLYLKREGPKRNFNVVPYWLRSQLSGYMKLWSENELVEALRTLIQAEADYKTASISDKEFLLLTLSKLG